MRSTALLAIAAFTHSSPLSKASPPPAPPVEEVNRQLDLEIGRLRRELDQREQQWIDSDTMLCICNVDQILPTLFGLASSHRLAGLRVEARDDEATRRATQRTVYQVHLRGTRARVTEFLRDTSTMKVHFFKMTDLCFRDDGETFDASFRLAAYDRVAALVRD